MGPAKLYVIMLDAWKIQAQSRFVQNNTAQSSWAKSQLLNPGHQLLAVQELNNSVKRQRQTGQVPYEPYLAQQNAFFHFSCR